MYLFGHLGIGLKLVEPWNKGLSRRFILLGAVLPDLIDKPLYYALSLATGHSGAALGLFGSTRTFGHAAILTVAVASVASLRRSRLLAALSLGMASHLLLDGVGDLIIFGRHQLSMGWLLWPFPGWQSPNQPFQSLGEHLLRITQPYFLCTELFGFSILAWEAWKKRNRAGIVTFLNERRVRKSNRLCDGRK